MTGWAGGAANRTWQRDRREPGSGREHEPCSGTTDDGTDLPCECQCHNRTEER